MNLNKFKITNKGLYWGLIVTFGILYACVGFVSTLHSITFFHLANTMGLAVLLGLTYEIGQASVLFSILMTKNKDKFLPWALMILLTALQVSANVYASFKYMVSSESNDWVYWQKSILFGVQAATPEMYQVIISWISGALLPVVALGMTALVANNMKLMSDEGTQDNSEEKITEEETAADDNRLFTKEEVEEILNDHGVITQPSDALLKTLENINNKLNKEKEVELLLRQAEKLKPPISSSFKDAVIKESELQTEINDELKDFLDKPESENIDKEEFQKIGEKLKEDYQRLSDANNPFLNFEKQIPEIKVSPLTTVVKPAEYNVPVNLPEGWHPGCHGLDVQAAIEPAEYNQIDGQLEPLVEESQEITPEDLQEIHNVLEEKTAEEKFYENKAAELAKDIDKQIVKSLLDSNEIIVNQPENLLETHTTILTKEFPKRKPGRPPKKKDEDVVEPKKEQELLQKEEVKVPTKRKRHQDPLKKKSKIKRVKRIEEINPPSKGDQVIALIENNEKERIKESINSTIDEDEKTHESLLVPPEILEAYTQNGVEVIDAKAIAKKGKADKLKVDKFGIPIQPGERKNFDRI